MVYLRNYDADFFNVLKTDTRGLLYFVKLVGTLAETNLTEVKACFLVGKERFPSFASSLEATVLEMKSTIETYMERSLQPESAVPVTNKDKVLSVEEILSFLISHSSDTLVITTATKILNGDYSK